MNHQSVEPVGVPTREQLLHFLYEAAELEHNLMCTYLYAAFSLRDPSDPSFSKREADAVGRFRANILRIATEEMGHLAAVWNITSALGGAPRFGRGNFPLDPGALPASVVVKLAPFSDAVLQHFIFLERPHDSLEPEGEGFAPEWHFCRGEVRPRVTPMPTDYDTVGEFYASLSGGISAFVALHGDQGAFCGDPSLQLSAAETNLLGIKPVICAKTALAALDAIVTQGEGAAADAEHSHYRCFVEMRRELAALRAENPNFSPAYPAAVNPVLRRPMRPQGRVWIEDESAAALVDSANSAYMLMLRLLTYAYVVPRPLAEKNLAVDLSVGLMRAASQLAEAAVRRPAGPSNPDCHAGMSFTALRDASAFPQGAGARRFFLERFDELSAAVKALADQGERERTASAILTSLTARARRGFEAASLAGSPQLTAVVQSGAASQPGATPQNGAAVSQSGAALQSGVAPQNGAASQPGAASQSGAVVSQPGAASQSGTASQGIAAPQNGAAALSGAALQSGVAASQPGAVLQSGAVVSRSGAGSQSGGAAAQPLVAVNAAAPVAPPTQVIDGVEHVEGQKLQLLFESKRCIHARFCVTGAPKVFLANVQGPWIHPDAMHVERLVEIAHACPSGAIRYRRKDAQSDETAPPVNLTSVRENGPYAVRGDIRLEGQALGYRATLCRCGASQNKPFCDGSHHAAPFVASGEPATGGVDMLPTRDGPLEFEPEINGPLVVRGNLEILSGTGRAVARVTAARLCRCGGSANKPFCDGTHARIGFRSV